MQLLLDRMAIGLSSLCLVHCLLAPSLLLMLPVFGALPLADESFHQWLVYGVLPISLVAIFMGCKRHQRKSVLLWACAGLGLMLLATILGHDYLGEFVEKALTVVASLVLVYSHIKNFRLCRRCCEAS